MSEYIHVENMRLRDMSREPYPTPCPDCGRTYLNGEGISISVPAPENKTRIAWSGCIDCWLRRTSLGHNKEVT